MSSHYAVALVSGGIHGARAVAVAGYSWLLLEKTAPAAGTASHSSKLIHGGLHSSLSECWPLADSCQLPLCLVES